MHQYELIESYALEIISRAQSIQKRCGILLSRNFASEAPKNLANVLIKICILLENACKSIFKSINWQNKNTKTKESFIVLQMTDFIIKDIGSHINYIDGAQTQKLPWSFIQPIEKLVKEFLPNVQIMLSPQWEYNYTILTTDLHEVYLNYLSRFVNYVSGENLDNILEPLGKSFHIVCFPSIERNNILLHCLLGHEIGHLASKKYFTKERKRILLQSIRDKVASIVEKKIKDSPPTKDIPPLLIPSVTQQIIQIEMERTSKMWERGLEEILSDIVGGFLFGPAILFSTLEIALQDLDGLDKTPDENNNYYPPWRMRLRNIFETIKELELLPLTEDKIGIKKVVSNVNQRFILIENMVNETQDKEGVKKDEIVKIAYEEIEKDIPEAKRFFKDELELKSLLVKPSNFFEHLSHLIERIDYGIPPNAFEKSIDERKPSTIVEIINSAWFHKLAWEDHLVKEDGNFNTEIFEKRSRMNRLTLKALEYSDIEIDYIDYNNKLKTLKK
jgi:type VI protein secretion system component Hcp